MIKNKIKTSSTAKWKREVVEKIKNLIRSFKTIAIINLLNLPAAELQKIKEKLEESKIIVARKKLILLALKDFELDNLSRLVETADIPALLFSNSSPNQIYAILQKNKIEMAIKPGQVTPKDVVIPAGPTPFAPGPIVSELAKFKIKTAVEAGRVVVKSDTVVAKAGDAISKELAAILFKFGIKPMEITLNMLGANYDKIFYNKDVISLTLDKIIKEIESCASAAEALAFNICWFTKRNVKQIIQKFFKSAFSFALNIGWISKETLPILISLANQKAQIIKMKAGII